MIEFIIEGYDKDNDVYDELKTLIKTKEEAIEEAKEIESQNLSSSCGDLYDWLVITKYINGTYVEHYNFNNGKIV